MTDCGRLDCKGGIHTCFEGCECKQEGCQCAMVIPEEFLRSRA